ncbi:MAG: acyltransferase [Aphanizomenon sp.]|jgi:acetyltransferase-like isoleucine patch superfamily enzyme
MIKQIFLKIKTDIRRFYSYRKLLKLASSCRESQIIVEPTINYINSNIYVGNKSSFVVEEEVTIENAFIKIGDNCQMVIQKNSVLKNVNFHILNGASVNIGTGAIFDNNQINTQTIIVDNGSLSVEEKVNIKADITIRFGGDMKIGKYSGIGSGTEIRCEEKIVIGSYALISYDVCIYDTNTHSVNWQERRKTIEKGYPIGANEEVKPLTQPVEIGDDVWIGKGATILKGTMIGNRSIVGIRTTLGGGEYPDDSVIVSPKLRVIQKNKVEL